MLAACLPSCLSQWLPSTCLTPTQLLCRLHRLHRLCRLWLTGLLLMQLLLLMGLVCLSSRMAWLTLLLAKRSGLGWLRSSRPRLQLLLLLLQLLLFSLTRLRGWLPWCLASSRCWPLWPKAMLT